MAFCPRSHEEKWDKIRGAVFFVVKGCEIGKLHLVLCSVLVPVRNPRPKRVLSNVLTRMQNVTGPLSVLFNCMERRVRIKVFTRNMAGVRGYCVAFLAAFDKHWNLALEDVHEVWTRRKRNKVPALGEPSAVTRRVMQPRVVVLRTERKTEVCERHVNQLLVRGEHVALVSVLDL